MPSKVIVLAAHPRLQMMKHARDCSISDILPFMHLDLLETPMLYTFSFLSFDLLLCMFAQNEMHLFTICDVTCTPKNYVNYEAS